MKRILFLLLLLLGTQISTVNAVASSPFSGFYAGGQLGIAQRSDKTELATAREGSNELKGISKRKNIGSLLYGLYVGYGQIYDSFYWGAEFSLGHGTGNKNTRNTLKFTDLTTGTAENGTLVTRYKRGVVFGVAPRVGIVFDRDNLIYVKLGIEASRDKAEARVDYAEEANAASVSKSKTQVVLVPGFGYERAFGNILARLEYGYRIGRKIQTGNLFKDVTAKTPVSLESRAHEFKFGMAYRF